MFRLITVVVVTCLLAASASAGVVGNINITIDENCNSLFTNPASFSSALPCALMADPGPGGAASALTYDMMNPPGLVTGDVLMYEGTTFSDVIRFNATGGPGNPGGTGSIVFYSNPLDGFDSLADIASPPGSFYTNAITLNYDGSTLVYTPTSGQPGFVANSAWPVTYTFISDVPEPTSLLLALSGGLLLLFRRRTVQ